MAGESDCWKPQPLLHYFSVHLSVHAHRLVLWRFVLLYWILRYVRSGYWPCFWRVCLHRLDLPDHSYRYDDVSAQE